MVRTVLLVIGSIVGLVGTGHFAKDLSPLVNGPVRTTGLEAHETHAGASLLGQFRTSTSSWLWLKTDLYLHNGVELRAQTEAEIASGEEQIHDADGWHDAIGDEVRHVTSIPGKKFDPRGFFGDIERATQSYSDMQGHTHIDPASALPLYRLMTWLDPQFLPGWIIGGTVLANERKGSGVKTAIAYLSEGLNANPQSVSLRVEISRLRINRQGDIPMGIPLLEEACNLARAPNFDPNSEDGAGAIDAFRWLSLCQRAIGEFQSSIDSASEGLKLFADDPVLTRLAYPAPGIWTPESQKEHFSEVGKS